MSLLPESGHCLFAMFAFWYRAGKHQADISKAAKSEQYHYSVKPWDIATNHSDRGLRCLQDCPTDGFVTSISTCEKNIAQTGLQENV